MAMSAGHHWAPCPRCRALRCHGGRAARRRARGRSPVRARASPAEGRGLGSGLTVLGRDTVSGEWTDTAVGLDGNHTRIALLQTPDGHGRLELTRSDQEPPRPNEIGMHRGAFSVDHIDEALETAARHGCHPLRGVATYQDVYKLTYVRGPSGILVMLAEELKKS
jgi:glyoxylase I family protein